MSKKKANIPLIDTKLIWGKSGMQCAICKCSLLVEGKKHIGEQAHIYGEKESAARYDQEQSSDFVNSFENIILVCSNCHTLIDKPPITEWTVERLFALKKQHEQRVLAKISQPKPDLIVRVVELFHQELENVEVDEDLLVVTTRPSTDYLREIKNPANEMSQHYADYLCEIYLKNTYYIDQFLAHPDNSETATLVQKITHKINKKLILENNGKLTADYFEMLCNEILSKYSELDDEQEDTLSTILFYLYWHCDIGLRE